MVNMFLDETKITKKDLFHLQESVLILSGAKSFTGQHYRQIPATVGGSAPYVSDRQFVEPFGIDYLLPAV